MTDPELAALFPYIMLACGSVLIIVSGYMWYRQKKSLELKELEKGI